MMIRKHFRITRRQNLLIKCLAKLRGVSEADVIRQAIEHETSAASRGTPQAQTAPEKGQV